MLEKNNLKKIKTEYLLGVFILCFLCLMLFLGYKKEYMYEDEVWSYTLANSHTDGLLRFENGEWITSEELFQEIVVMPDERFDYKNAIHNQTLDAHPPFYAIILHTVCSLFPGKFSKWFGLSINFVAFIFLIAIYYKQLKVLFDDGKKALYITAMYSLSLAMMIRILYIRMYMILVVFTSLCMLLHISKLKQFAVGKSNGNLSDIKSEKVDIKFICLLIVCTFFGGFTHFYYFVFAFFVSAFYCLYLVFNKQYKQIIQYVLAYVVAFVMLILAYGSAFTVLENSDYSVFSGSDVFPYGTVRLRLGTIIQIISEQMFGKLLKPILLIFVIYIIWLFVSKKMSTKDVWKIDISYYMIAFTIAGYFAVITLTAPYICDRHYFPIFGYIFLLAVVLLINIADEIFKSKTLGRIIIFVFAALPLFMYLRAGVTDVNTPLRRQIASENKNTPCIFTSNIYAEENVFDLMEYEKVFYYDYESELNDEEIKNAKELVVYVPDGNSAEDYMAMLRQYNSSISNIERLYVGSYCTVYKFY